MRLLFTLFLFIFNLYASAQSFLNSIENFLKDKDDSTCASIYIELTTQHMYQDDSLCLEMAKRAERHGLKAGNKALEGTGQLFLALNIEEICSNDSAIKVFEKSFETLNSINTNTPIIPCKILFDCIPKRATTPRLWNIKFEAYAWQKA